MRKTIKRIAALMLALIVALPFIASCEKKSPMETIEDALNISAEAYAENAGSQLLEELAYGGSMELKAEAGPYLGMLLGSVDTSFNPGASLKYYFDIMQGKIALTAGLTSSGVSVADALLYIADNSVSLSSTALFGKNVYGFSLENFAENFNNSEFGENGAFSIDISKEELEYMCEALSQATAGMMIDTMKYTKETDAAWKSLRKDLYPMIESHGIVETVEGSVTVGGNPHNTKDIVFTYTGDQLVEMIAQSLTMIRDHEGTYASLKAYADMCVTYYPEATITVMDKKFSGDELTAEALHETLKEAIDEILAEKDTVKEELAPYTIAITIHISNSTKEIVGFDIYVTEEDNYAELRYVFGPSITDIDEIGVYTKGYSAEEDELTESSVVYLVTRNDEDAYSAKINVTGEAELSLLSIGTDLFTIDWDKKDGDYTISATMDGQTVGIGGKYLQEEDSLTMSVNTITTQGVSINFGEIALIFRTNDPIPENGAYTDLLTMDAEALEALFTEVMTAVEQIASVFGG